MKLELISRYPSAGAHHIPLLFVHGAWHGAWCWDVHFLDYFTRNGFAAHAVSLRGHGESEGRDNLRWTRIADYVVDLAHAVRHLPCQPILIGHSMGAFVIQKYLEEFSAPAAVLMTPPPPGGLLAATLRIALRHPMIFARSNMTLSLFPLVSTPGLAREAFFSSDMAEGQVMNFWQLMQDESFMAFLDMLVLDLPDPGRVKTPLLVLGASRDNLLKPREIEATAYACNTQSEFISGVAHDMMLEPGWEGVARRILEWLKAQILPANAAT